MWKWMLAAALVAASCESPVPRDEPADAAAGLVFKMMTKEQTFEDCIAGEEGCTYIRLDYPVLVDGPDGYALTAVTDAVFNAVTAAYAEASYPSVEALMASFIGEYVDLKQAMPAYAHPWFLERKVFVLNNTPEVLGLSLSERLFTGGAHGSATLTFQNLDPQSGEEILLSDLLTDGYEAELLPIAEARFREVREIEEGMSLADAGFTFENGIFYLTDNFAIGKDGLTFYYNPYDVAAYAVGSTEMFLTYEELGGLLKE